MINVITSFLAPDASGSAPASIASRVERTSPEISRGGTLFLSWHWNKRAHQGWIMGGESENEETNEVLEKVTYGNAGGHQSN